MSSSDFYRQMLDSAGVGLWHLDYRDVDVTQYMASYPTEASLLRAIVRRPDLFHDALDEAFVEADAEWRGRNAFFRGSYVWSHYYGNFDQDNTTTTNDAAIFYGSSFISDPYGRIGAAPDTPQ